MLAAGHRAQGWDPQGSNSAGPTELRAGGNGDGNGLAQKHLKYLWLCLVRLAQALLCGVVWQNCHFSEFFVVQRSCGGVGSQCRWMSATVGLCVLHTWHNPTSIHSVINSIKAFVGRKHFVKKVVTVFAVVLYQNTWLRQLNNFCFICLAVFCNNVGLHVKWRIF